MVLIGFGAIGFVDDYLMQVKKQSKGLSVRGKLVLQVVLGLAAGALVYATPNFSTEITLPFFKTVTPEIGWGYILFATLVIVGASNAVNLTDGLDGLAIGPMTIAATHLHDLRLRRRQREDRRLPPDHLRPGLRRDRGPVRGHRGRRAGVPVVQRLPGPGVHGRHRVARRSGPCWAPSR